MADPAKFTTVTIDSNLMSSDITDIGTLPITRDELESGGYGQDKRYVVGRGDAPITLTGNWTTTAITGTHTVLEPLSSAVPSTPVVLLFELGQGAAPTTGDPTFTGTYVLSDYQRIGPLDGLATFTAKFALSGDLPVWGTKA